MMAESPLPGEAPVSLNEARGWLRMGATVDDAVVAGLIRAATNICEAFIGQWLIVRAVEERIPIDAGAVRLAAQPVTGIDSLALLVPGAGERPLAEGDYRVTVGRDGRTRIAVERADDAERLRVAYRAGIADGPNGVPEAIRQGILRMTQHLHDARDGSGTAPPAAIAALWQPWRRLTLGSGR